jgi:predicted secreted Zn-dependent protease
MSSSLIAHLLIQMIIEKNAKEVKRKEETHNNSIRATQTQMMKMLTPISSTKK